MSAWLVTRHPGAVDWVQRQGIKIDHQVSHLDPERIAPGDYVVGTLPVNLIAQVNQQGGRYWHLTLNIPPEMRGQELDLTDLQTYGASLEEYAAKKILSGEYIKQKEMI